MNNDYSADPLEQFHAWYREGGSDRVALATATAAGVPSARMVLLKASDERGLVVATSYESRKGRELGENPRAALLFYWPELGRQVRVEGRVERLDEAESDAIFAARPRGAQLAAHASRQSERIASRAVLEERFAAAGEKFPGDVPRPPRWGGYRLVPERYEFWVHDDDRLHDRLLYERAGDGWQMERLSP